MELVKASQELIADLNKMEEEEEQENEAMFDNNTVDDADNQDVDLIAQYDKEFENFFKRKDSLMNNIQKLSKLRYGKNSDAQKALVDEAKIALTRQQTVLTQKRNQSFRMSIKKLKPEEQAKLMEKKKKLDEEY